MEEETFLPKSKAYVFRGFELVFTYKNCNKPSVNLMFESIAVKVCMIMVHSYTCGLRQISKEEKSLSNSCLAAFITISR